jgi:hypothetical protein
MVVIIGLISNQAYQHVDKRVKNGKFNSFLPGNSP